MQVMDNGKILYVDNNNQITTWVDPRVGASVQTGYYGGAAPTRRGPFFNSPPSPLSLMDVLTIGSGSALAEERKPLTGNRIGEEEDDEEEEEEFYDNDKLETDGEAIMLQPPPERLLPIGSLEPLRCGGGRNGFPAGRSSSTKQHQSLSLLDRVWQVLGSSAETEDCLPLVENDGASAGGPKLPNGVDVNLVESEADNYTAASQPPQGGRQQETVRPPLSGGRQRKLGTAKEPPTLVAGGGGGATKDVADSVSEGAGGGWMTADSAQSSCCDPPFKDLASSSGRGGGGQPAAHQLRQSQLRVGEDTVVDRCSTCGAIREKYSQVKLAQLNLFFVLNSPRSLLTC